MQAVSKKKEASSSRKAELQKDNSDLEEMVQGLDEQLETACLQLEVGCLHHALRQLLAVHSHTVCMLSGRLLSVPRINCNASAAVIN